MKLILCLFVLIQVFLVIIASKPTYDHQNVTYNAQFEPVSVENTRFQATPFFSPDHSIEQLAKILQSATSSIDISTPGFSSWNGCTSTRNGCQGCSAQKIIEIESFPVFTILVNAIQKGIHVRILTNDYEDKLCDNTMDLLAYLQILGAEVKFYTSTSFTHSKLIIVDGRSASISSINFSKTSIMSNREAGMILHEDDSGIVKFALDVFNYDHAHGYIRAVPPVDDSQIQAIKSTTHLTVTVPDPYVFKYCNATSPKPTLITGHMDMKIIASPDYAFDNIMKEISGSPLKSLWLSIYQITMDEFCDDMISLKKANPDMDLRLFVSNDIYGKADKAIALKCYGKLLSSGVAVKMSHKYCLSYSHQKYWIVNGDTVFMSTGNWSPSDYPTAPYVFPPYGESNWRKVNRDYTLRISNSNGILNRFSDLFISDYDQGYDFVPETTLSDLLD